VRATWHPAPAPAAVRRSLAAIPEFENDHHIVVPQLRYINPQQKIRMEYTQINTNNFDTNHTQAKDRVQTNPFPRQLQTYIKNSQIKVASINGHTNMKSKRNQIIPSPPNARMTRST
jgi:hypothetical protein